MFVDYVFLNIINKLYIAHAENKGKIIMHFKKKLGKKLHGTFFWLIKNDILYGKLDVHNRLTCLGEILRDVEREKCSHGQ